MSFLLKARTQVNDMFSNFSLFISPMYYHDRCERTLQMYVYIMHKREVLLSLCALLSSYVLLLFIGLAGPNVDRINSVTARKMFAESNIINESYVSRLLSYGPFVMTTSTLSPYSQQLSLHMSVSLKNEEYSEAFHKEFDVFVDLEGINSIKNRSIISQGHLKAALYCSGRRCDPIRVLKLLIIEYQQYRVNLTFHRLNSVNEKYTIEDMLFEFRSINISFTTLFIWFRFFFLFVTFLMTCFYMHYLYRFPIADWSLEQKWTSAKLILLILSNNPFYPIQFLLGSEFPYLFEVWLHTTLQTLIMLFWLCFFHGIRQNSRTFFRFYFIKLLIVGTIWFTVIYAMSWSLQNQLQNAIFDELFEYNHSVFLQLLSAAFYTSIVSYFIYLMILVFSAFTELRSMPYFDVRLKLQTFLMLFVLSVSLLTVLISTTPSSSSSTSSSLNSIMISLIPFLQMLPFSHFSSSSATFLSIFSLVNIYICACAFYYRPSLNQANECHIIRDNPTLSMINDSDEETILYGSDTEELLKIQAHQQPNNEMQLFDSLNQNNNNNSNNSSFIPNLIDTRTDEESD